MIITFDHTDHTYKVGGRYVPSVTQVLAPLSADYKFVNEDLLRYKSELGSAVHKAVELDAKGSLDRSTLHVNVIPYFEQWLRFVDDYKVTPIASEMRVGSVLGYAGTLDLIASIGMATYLIDIKTTARLSPAVKLQTAAYKKAYQECSPHHTNPIRAALRLTKDNYYFETEMFKDDAGDLSAFCAFLNVHKWCANNNQAKQFK